MHYFDYNATAPLHPVAREAWLEVQDRLWANPSSPSRFAAQAHHRLECCRERWGGFFGVEPSRIVFTAGASVANNAIFAHLAEVTPREERVLVSSIEHPSILEAAERWFPGRVEGIPVGPSGAVDLEAIENRLRGGGYAAVAVMAANNETGILQPLEALAELTRSLGIRWICDAAQWLGKRGARDLPAAEYRIVSGHKFGGPRGVGVVVLGAAEAAFRGPVGGGQENAHWAGTEDLAGIAAMTAALEVQDASGWSAAGRDRFADACRSMGYEAVGGREAPRLPNTLSLRLPRHASSRWVTRLDKRGWIVSSGSACATGQGGPSHVLAAMGLSVEEAKRVIRISGGPQTLESEWEELLEAIQAVQSELDEDAGGERLVTVVEV